MRNRLRSLRDLGSRLFAGSAGESTNMAARPSGAAPGVSGSIAAPDTRVPATGLVALQLEFNGISNGPARDWTLVLGFSDPELATFRKSVSAIDGAARCSFTLNSHLMPNGVTEIRAQLIADDGTVGWRGTTAVNVLNRGCLADQVRASMRSYGTPLVVDGACDSSHYDFADESLKPWFDRPDALDHINEMQQNGRVSAQEAESLAAFVSDGYLVADGVVESELLDLIGRELEDAVARKVEGYEYGSSQRIHNLHLVYPGIRRLWSHPRIMRLLALIFESEPRPCQTLTYIFGSQQDAHQDTVHLTPFPAGYMCGVWVAIDDVQPRSGELQVYRGSHRLPRIYTKTAGCAKVTNGDYSEFGSTIVPMWQQMLGAGGFERIVYQPKRGTVLIWHENLMHAGAVRLEKSLSRRSVVSHVFANGAVAFYDTTGLPGSTTGLEDLPPVG
jgi:hypothetical protein